MSNQLALSGAQPSKPGRYTPLYTGRFFSGIWTNRSPLRDAGSTRLQEKYYGGNGDGLIDGLNVEITNRLTLARRPGNSVWNNNTWTNIDRFDNFRLFSPLVEQVKVMVDQEDALYVGSSHSIPAQPDDADNLQQLVFTKSAGAGPSYMQGVGNELYFGNGVDNKKWLESLYLWQADFQWNSGNNPFLTTFFIDENGNIQQLTSTVLTVTHVNVTTGTLTITVDSTIDGTSTNFPVIAAGLQIRFPSSMDATWLEDEVLTVDTVSGATFTTTTVPSGAPPSYDADETPNVLATVVAGGNPVSASIEPTWSTTVPSAGNNFQGGTTLDGSALWTNRGTTVENWGIAPPDETPVVTVGASGIAWRANTVFSIAQITVDTNGNLQQITTAGKSGTTQPTWNASLSGTTTDGTAVWTNIKLNPLGWQPSTAYTYGDFIVESAGGVDCLFQLQSPANGFIKLNSAVTIKTFAKTASAAGAFDLFYGGSVGAPKSLSTSGTPASVLETLSEDSLLFNDQADATGNMQVATQDGTGNVISRAQLGAGYPSLWEMCVFGTMDVSKAGSYTFSSNHDDGMFFAISDGAILQSGSFVEGSGFSGSPHVVTAWNGYSFAGATKLGGQNNSGNWPNNSFTVYFPTAGTYNYEFNYAQWQTEQWFTVRAQGNNIVPNTPTISGTGSPIFPAWNLLSAPNYPTVTESSGLFRWVNLGPITDYVWRAEANYTLPGTTITDPNGNTESPYETGITGSTAPTFQTGINQLTTDNPNLVWINQGPAAAPPVGTVSTFNGGWRYAIALVNTLDDTVSNASFLSASTGNFIGATSVHVSGGLPPLSEIDPQVDYVAIFRTTDGEATPFLIPGDGNSLYTISLADYIANGYDDDTPDTELNNLISAPLSGENTPPLSGAINLTYHLNRIWYSIGNTVYWTAGPDTPVGNGVNGTPPLNFDVVPSQVKRLIPTSIGMIVITVSDILLIAGLGTSNNPIQGAQPYINGVGCLSYDAVSINGTIVGIFTSDRQFVILDPTSGFSYAGFPIGDKFRISDGEPGTNWLPSNVFLTWHASGEDQAWYVADGEFGWYRLCPTPAPEAGYTWSPFAEIVNGAGAIRSIETSPGVHKLLVAPNTVGPILMRDLTVFADNDSTYPASAVIGSLVLANPGQIAEVAFITTESVQVGLPMEIGVIVDEALPYYQGPFEYLTNWENDPPNLPPSTSIRAQRFYLSELRDQAAVCRHMQIQVKWINEAVQNELLTITVFGSYQQEM